MEGLPLAAEPVLVPVSLQRGSVGPHQQAYSGELNFGTGSASFHPLPPKLQRFVVGDSTCCAETRFSSVVSWRSRRQAFRARVSLLPPSQAPVNAVGRGYFENWGGLGIADLAAPDLRCGGGENGCLGHRLKELCVGPPSGAIPNGFQYFPL